MCDSSEDVLPEKIFLWAILERAIHDATGNFKLAASDTPYIQREALQWVRSKSEREFGFEWICLHLDMCADVVRRSVFSHVGEKFVKPQARETRIFTLLQNESDEHSCVYLHKYTGARFKLD